MVHQRVLDLRILEYLVKTTKFNTAYKNANDIDRTMIEDLIRLADCTTDINHLKDFINHLLRERLEEKGIKELRLIASDLYIIGFNQLSKIQLISIIEEHKNDKNRSHSTHRLHARQVGRNSKKTKDISDYSL